jgi:hypothetical protein
MEDVAVFIVVVAHAIFGATGHVSLGCRDKLCSVSPVPAAVLGQPRMEYGVVVASSGVEAGLGGEAEGGSEKDEALFSRRRASPSTANDMRKPVCLLSVAGRVLPPTPTIIVVQWLAP